MTDAIQQFTSLIAFIPVALGIVMVSVIGLVYLSSWFQATRRPTMWKNF